MNCLYFLVFVLNIFANCDGARILALLLMPSESHQMVYRPIIHELAKRGHDTVIITSDPAFPKGKTPKNIREIDLHNISYPEVRQDLFNKRSEAKDYLRLFRDIIIEKNRIFVKQMQAPEVKEFFENKTEVFDLIFVETGWKIALSLTQHLKAPVIVLTPAGVLNTHKKFFGIPKHNFIYPQCVRPRTYNLTLMEKIKQIYIDCQIDSYFIEGERRDNELLKKIYGPKAPTIDNMMENVHMIFFGAHRIWDDNIPVPPNAIYLGGITVTPKKPLPLEFQKHLNSSNRDVIYVSFGTNYNTSYLPPGIVQKMVNVFSKLPYNVIWKWDTNEMPGRAENIKIWKRTPQPDLLRHPKVKLFVTHCGLRSTEDAIDAEVPLLGIPIAFDQFCNAEKYVRLGIGSSIDINTFTEEQFENAVRTLIQDGSYRRNLKKLKRIMKDEPTTPLQRAVWWSEYVIRNKGAKHLKAKTNITWTEYYEVQLVLTVALILVILTTAITLMLYCGCRYLVIKVMKRRKLKRF